MNRGNPYKQLRLKLKGETGKPLTITELGEKLGLSPACISKIERDINTPTLEVIVTYQRYFGIPYEELIDPVFRNYSCHNAFSHRKK